VLVMPRRQVIEMACMVRDGGVGHTSCRVVAPPWQPTAYANPPLAETTMPAGMPTPPLAQVSLAQPPLGAGTASNQTLPARSARHATEASDRDGLHGEGRGCLVSCSSLCRRVCYCNRFCANELRLPR
jgi:hypothetical protein